MINKREVSDGYKNTNFNNSNELFYPVRPSHTDHHIVSTASCVKTTLALPTKKLACHEIETNISSTYEH